MADVNEILDLVNLAEQTGKAEDIQDIRRRAAGTKAQAALTQRGVLPLKYMQGQQELERAKRLRELSEMSVEQVKDHALRAAHEEMRGQGGPAIAQRYQQRLQELLAERRQWKELRQAGQAKVEAVAEAYKKGAAPAPGPVYPPAAEQGAMASGLPYTSPRLDYEEFRRETGIPIPPEAIEAARRAGAVEPPPKIGAFVPNIDDVGEGAWNRMLREQGSEAGIQARTPKPRVGPPAKSGGSALATIGRALDKPSRLMVAGITGALRALDKGSKDVQIQPTEFRTMTRAPGEKVRVSEITRTGGIPNEAFSRVFSDPELRRNMVNSVLEHVKGAWRNEDPQSVYDLATFLRQAQERYKQEAERRALKTLDVNELKQLDLRTATEMVDTTAKGMYEDLIRQDVAGALGALDHELVTQMVTQFALDPLWFVTPEKVAQAGRGALKAARAVPGVGRGATALLEGAQALSAAFLSKTEKARWMGMLWELDQAGTAGARDLADLMRSATLRAPNEYREFVKAANDYLKVVDKLDPADKALFARVADWGSYPKGERLSAAEAMANLPEDRAQRFKDALEAYAGWQMEHEWLREGTGIGNFWVGKGAGRSLRPAAEAHVQRPWPVEGGGYVPRRQTADPAQQAALVEAERRGRAAYAGRGRMTPASARARKAEPGAETTSKWLQDVAEQAKYETHGPIGPAATSAAEMKFIKRFAEQVNLSKKGTNVRAGIMEIPAKSLRRLQKEGKVQGVLGQLERETGMTWAVMDERELVEPWMRVTGERGEVMGSRAYLVPTAIKKRIDQLVPVVVAGGHEPSDAWRAVDTALKWTVRPVNLFGRWVTTIPNFMFAPRNAIGAEILGYLAYGPGVLDPRAQKLAAEVAAGLTYDMPKWWLESTTTLMNGEAIKRADLLRVAREDMGAQLGARLTQYTDPLARTRTKRTLQAARDFPQKAAEFVGKHTLWGTPIPAPEALSSAKVAEVSENFQHALGYAPGLAGVDDLSRARAIEQMGKYFGDYRRLSRIEKSVLNETIFFYSWVKFISGRGLRAIWDNPKRVANFQTLKQHFERAWGAQAPVPPEALPEYYRGTAVTAPPAWQTPEVKQRMAEARARYEGISVGDVLKRYNDGKAELPEMGSDAFVAMVIDEPLAMSLYWADNLVGAVTGYGDQNFYDLTAPMTAAVIGTLVGIDPWGRRRPGLEVAKQHARRLTTAARPFETWKRVGQLYLEETPEPTTNAGQLWRNLVQDLLDKGHLSEAARETMRYQMVNDLPFMKPIMESATGEEYPALPPVPGWIRTKRLEPQKTKDRAATQAIEDVGLRAWELKQLEDM